VTEHTALSSFPTDPTEPRERDLTDPVAVRKRDEAGTRRPSDPAKGDAGRRSALVVAASLLAGLVAALALVLGPFAGDREAVITGAFLLGFAVGWALLAVLSERFTDRPQRWAAVPAAAMALTGLGLVVGAQVEVPGRGACGAGVGGHDHEHVVVGQVLHGRRAARASTSPDRLQEQDGLSAHAADQAPACGSIDRRMQPCSPALHLSTPDRSRAG